MPKPSFPQDHDPTQRSTFRGFKIIWTKRTILLQVKLEGSAGNLPMVLKGSKQGAKEVLASTWAFRSMHFAGVAPRREWLLGCWKVEHSIEAQRIFILQRAAAKRL
jgi:hypothetical protein